MITYAEFGYLCGNLIFPLAVVLYTALHFAYHKKAIIYIVFMILVFFTMPAWFVGISGLFLIGLDYASRWAKERKEKSTYVDLK